MFINNLKDARLKNNLKQEEVASILKVNRNTYGYWENGTILIPIDKLDELANYYKVSLSYLLSIENNYITKELKPINYKKMSSNLLLLKIESRKTYKELGSILGIESSSLYRYINNQTKFKVDTLVSISKYFKVDIDKLCGKK